MTSGNNKQIAKNTIFLYFRMLLVMIVNLYTSRVTLKALGIEDYGIYQTVGGVVTFLSFLSNALGSGTSRFITFELGKEKPKLNELFSTVRFAHIVIGIFIFIIGEIIGLWIIYNKLIIPVNRLEATVFAFHFSMVTTFFQITQVPYNALIIAYERMNIYAYVSIFEVIGKLIIVYLLNIFLFDKLETYSILMCIVTVTIMLIYRIYCKNNFSEAKTKLKFDKNLFKEVSSFSSWNLLTSSSASLANQGVTIITSMFFNPTIVTVRTLALKINSTINQFIGSFRTAVNPQIIKKYAAGDYKGSKQLALESTRYTYYLMLFIVLPLFLLTEPTLKLWLGEVPDNLVIFVRIALIQGIFQVFDTSLYVPIYAKGRIKENAIISPLFDSLQLPIVYIFFKLGAPAIIIAWIELFACVALGIIIKPILVHLIAGYSYLEIIKMIIHCIYITIIVCIVPFIMWNIFDESSLIGFLLIALTSFISISSVIWFIGLNKYMKFIIIKYIKNKLLRK